MLSSDLRSKSEHIVCVCFNVLRSSSTHEWRFEMDGRARASDANNTLIDTQWCDRFNSDPQTGVEWRQASLCNLRSEYRCSMCPAIHTNSRILLRPSSTYEPSDPPLKFLFNFLFQRNNPSMCALCVCKKTHTYIIYARFKQCVLSQTNDLALANSVITHTCVL